MRISPDKLDLALVPGIVFDKKGNRIGYGKGFYDRLLKHIECPTIGVGYKEQLFKRSFSPTLFDVPLKHIELF